MIIGYLIPGTFSKTDCINYAASYMRIVIGYHRINPNPNPNPAPDPDTDPEPNPNPNLNPDSNPIPEFK